MKKVVEVLRRIVQISVPGLTARNPAVFVKRMKRLNRHVSRRLEFMPVCVKTSALLRTPIAPFLGALRCWKNSAMFFLLLSLKGKMILLLVVGVVMRRKMSEKYFEDIVRKLVTCAKKAPGTLAPGTTSWHVQQIKHTE